MIRRFIFWKWTTPVTLNYTVRHLFVKNKMLEHSLNTQQRTFSSLSVPLLPVSTKPDETIKINRRYLFHRLCYCLNCPFLVLKERELCVWPRVTAVSLLCVCQVCLVFSVECVLSQMQQVLETHEVNWRHVLSCLSHLLIYHSQTQRCLTGTRQCSSASDEWTLREKLHVLQCLSLCSDLLSRLLRSAFDRYDVEKMITLFLLARQASLEGPAVFPSYSDWFKVCALSSNTHILNALVAFT